MQLSVVVFLGFRRKWWIQVPTWSPARWRARRSQQGSNRERDLARLAAAVVIVVVIYIVVACGVVVIVVVVRRGSRRLETLRLNHDDSSSVMGFVVSESLTFPRRSSRAWNG